MLREYRVNTLQYKMKYSYDSKKVKKTFRKIKRRPSLPLLLHCITSGVHSTSYPSSFEMQSVFSTISPFALMYRGREFECVWLRRTHKPTTPNSEETATKPKRMPSSGAIFVLEATPINEQNKIRVYYYSVQSGNNWTDSNGSRSESCLSGCQYDFQSFSTVFHLSRGAY